MPGRTQRASGHAPHWPSRGIAPVSAVAVAAFLALLAATPPAAALSLKGHYYTQCYGTQEGTVFPYSTGNNTGGTFTNNYANGSLTLAKQVSRSPPAVSSLESAGWISMGPGPTNGSCFYPKGSTGSVDYRFGPTSFSVSLKADCPGHDLTGDASANYSIVLQGNIYDLSSASFVWPSSLATKVAAHSVSCTNTGSASFVHRIVHLLPIQVHGNTTSLSHSNSYWFIVDVLVETSTTASGTGASASAKVSDLSTTLTSIVCKVC